MNKRRFIAPYIALTGLDGGESGGVIGGGSAQNGVPTPVEPMSYEAWLESDWAEDLIQNDTIDQWDYALWWESWGFSQEDWVRLNPGLDWDTYMG